MSMVPDPSALARRPAPGEAPSRRTLLQLSAVGAAVSLVPGCVQGSQNRDAAPVPDWGAADIPDQTGRRVLVTGGNGYPQDGRSGLGYHVALELARAGAAVTIASRRQDRGADAVRRIRAEVPGAVIRFEPLDLADLGSVQAFAGRMSASGEGLDLMVNNAGVMGRRELELSVDGFERVFATNTLGHFALTALMLPMLQRGQDPQVVWVSSLRMAGGLSLTDLPRPQAYDYAAAYDNSKLANLLLAHELDRRSRAEGWGVASLAAHPGVARTNLIPDGPGLDSAEGFRFRFLPFMFRPAAQGALPILYAGAAPQAEAGGYYGPTAMGGLRGPPGPAPAPSAAQDPDAAADLWTVLERLAGVSFG